MNKTINQLIEYGLKNHMISKEDESYAVNLLLDLLKILDSKKFWQSDSRMISDWI